MIRPIVAEKVKRISALVIGGSGVGKTSLIRTLNEPVFIISAEAGLLCISDLINEGKVKGAEIKSFEELIEVYDLLNTIDMKSKYKWIYIDSLTEIAYKCEESLKKKGQTGYVLWGNYNDLITDAIKKFRDMQDYNVVFTCLSEMDKDENSKRFYNAFLPGEAIKKKLMSFFDEVLYLQVESNEHRRLLTQPIEAYPAKDRSGKLKKYEEADLNSIMEKILN